MGVVELLLDLPHVTTAAERQSHGTKRAVENALPRPPLKLGLEIDQLTYADETPLYHACLHGQRGTHSQERMRAFIIEFYSRCYVSLYLSSFA